MFLKNKYVFHIPFFRLKLHMSLFFKGQIKPKSDWRAIDSPKKQTNKFILFAFLLFMANKTNLFVRFLGESTARPNCFRFDLTFSKSRGRPTRKVEITVEPNVQHHE